MKNRITRTQFFNILLKLLAFTAGGGALGLCVAFVLNMFHMEWNVSEEGRRALMENLYLPLILSWAKLGAGVGAIYLFLQAARPTALAVSATCAVSLVCLFAYIFISEAPDSDPASPLTNYIFLASLIGVLSFVGQRIARWWKMA